MNDRLKRFLSLLMAFVMILSNAPLQVFATEGEESTPDHAYIGTVTTDATCGAEGVTTYTCSVEGCAEHPVYTEAIAATGAHSYAEGVCSVCGGADPNAVVAASEEDSSESEVKTITVYFDNATAKWSNVFALYETATEDGLTPEVTAGEGDIYTVVVPEDATLIFFTNGSPNYTPPEGAVNTGWQAVEAGKTYTYTAPAAGEDSEPDESEPDASEPAEETYSLYLTVCGTELEPKQMTLDSGDGTYFVTFTDVKVTYAAEEATAFTNPNVSAVVKNSSGEVVSTRPAPVMETGIFNLSFRLSAAKEVGLTNREKQGSLESEDDNVIDTAAELKAALAAGGEVTLGGNIELTNESLVVPKDVEAVLDMNGHTITGYHTEAKVFALIENRGELTITNYAQLGPVSISLHSTAEASTAYAVNTILNCGTLTVEKGQIANYFGEQNAAAGNQIGYAIDNNSTSSDVSLTLKGNANIAAYGSNYYDGIRQYCNSTTYTNHVSVEGNALFSSLWVQNPSDGSAGRNTKKVNGSFTVAANEGAPMGTIYVEPNLVGTSTFTSGIIGSVEYTDADSGELLTGFISGGKFLQKQPDAAMIKDGYEAVSATVTIYGSQQVDGFAIQEKASEPVDSPVIDVPDDAPVVDTETNQPVAEETVTEIKEAIANNEAIQKVTSETTESLPTGAELKIEFLQAKVTDGKLVELNFDVKPMNGDEKVTPTAAVTFRLPIPDMVTMLYAVVHHDGELMGTYEIKTEGDWKYVEVSSADFSEFTVVPTDDELWIDTAAELQAFAAAVNGGETFEGKTVKLTADIDLSSVANWTPIGNGTNYFWGTFDGQGHTISNMTINVNDSATNQYVGLFGGVRKATIKDLKLTNVKIDAVGAKVYAGPVAGIAHSNSENHTTANLNFENITVDGCTINAESKAGSAYVGGFVGYCYPANMTNISVSNLTVNPKASGSTFAGGLVGYMQGQNISNNGNTRAYYTVDTFNLNNITIKSESNDTLAGGFAGYTYYGYITLKNGKINGIKVEVDVTKEALIGGLIGLAHRSDKGHTFTNVDITGVDFDITSDSGVDVLVGGMVGYSGSPIAYSDCSVSGEITEKTRNADSSAIVGGFVGGTVSYAQSYTDCVADVDIEATNYAGGFVGSNGATATYTNCEAKGTVEAPTAAGFAGYVNNNATITNCTYTGESDVPFIAGLVAQVGTTYYKTLAEAITAANAVEGGATVTLLDNVTLGEKLTISGNVTISGEFTITRDDAYTGTLFAVNSGATLTLDGGLVIDGANNYAFDADLYAQDLANWETPVAAADSAKWFTPEEGAPVAAAFMITTTGGTVNLNQVTIQNNYSTGSGVVSAGANSTVNLKGAKITHVAVTQNSGVVVNASGANINVVMDEGTVIDGNHVGGNHGIFKIYSGAKLTMNGGEVKNTTGWNSNGTVVGMYNGSFEMNGGTICSNSSVYGPNNGRNAAIYGHRGHTFIMNGGTICHNTGRSKAGIDSPYSDVDNTGKTIINGGSVVDNTVVGNWNEPDVSGGATLTINGGTFSTDVSKYLAPNTGLVYNEETDTYTTTDVVYKLWFRDPATGEQGTVGPLQGNDPASLVATGKLFYADYYEMELEVLSNAKINETVVVDYPMTINLNGKTISVSTEMNATPAFRILSDVTVKNGTVDATAGTSTYAFIVGNGTTAGNLTITDGTYKGSTTAASVTKGTLTIEGGNFAATEYTEYEADGTTVKFSDHRYTLNCIDANYKNGTAKIEVKGGTFYKFNPADNAAEGTGTSFVAEDYLAEADGDYYSVRKSMDALDPIVTITYTDSNSNSEVTLKYPSERYDSIQKLIGTNDYADFVLGAEQSELLAAIADGRASNIVMTLHEDIELDAPINFYNKYFQIPVEYDITLIGKNNSITWADGYTGTLINVESGVSLTMQYVTIDGENEFTFYEDTTTVENGQNWYTRFVDVGDEDKAVNANVIVNAGNLKLLNGFKIVNVTIASDSGNGKTENTETGYVLKYNDDLALIKSNGGTVTMNNAYIRGNAGLVLNAVNATTTITGTPIVENMGCGNKGGLIIANGGTMNIGANTNGVKTSILHNKAMARSATILGVINGAEVTFNGYMNGNKHLGVGSNTAGAMVVLEGASRFVMNGGEIMDNVGGRAGAIASRWVGGSFGQHEETSIVLNAGLITRNTASNDSWNNASIFLRSPATIGEKMKIDGTIAVNAAPAELDITGGTFTNFNLVVTDGLSAEITGGTFDADPSQWLANGYHAPKTDNSWTVAPWNLEIWTASDLMVFAKMANAGNNFSGKTVKLMADIDLGGAAWTPIKSFAGTFDGGNHTISNFNLDGTNGQAGFFASLGQYPAAVKNLTLSDVTGTAGTDRFAILAATGHTATVTNVHIKNAKVTTIHKDAKVGAIYGYFNWTSASNCTIENFEVDATAGAMFIGGFAGWMDQDLTMDNVDINGFKVTVSDTDNDCAVGGFTAQTQTGHRQPTFTNCDITGLDVTATGTVDVGGFIADPGAHTIVNKSTVAGKIDATGITNGSAGGFLADYGWNNNESSKGGHKLTNCSAAVDIITNTAPAGGFVGSATNDNNRNMPATLTNCSATGTITVAEGGTANIGGFAGEADRGTYTNCSATQSPFIGYVVEGSTLKNINSYVAQVGDSYYADFAAALTAAKASEAKAMTLLAPVVITEDVTLDLSGVTITGDVYPAFRIQNNANVTVKGGNVTNGDYVFVLGAADAASAGYLTIESGSYTGETTVASVTNGTLTITGGTFESTGEYGATYLLNCIDANYKDGSAKIVVKGGSFKGFNPADNEAEGADTNFLSPECVTVQDGEMWVVNSYIQWIKDQLLAGNDVTLDRDIVVDGSMIESIPAPTNGNGKYPNYGIFNVVGDHDVTFDLNGHTITYEGHKEFQWNGKTYNSCTVAHGLFFANDGADLTVKDSVGTGTVMVYGLASGAYVASPDTTFTITGGTWKNEGCKTCGGTNIFLYPLQGGELYITGGHFEQALDAEGESYLIVNHNGEYANSVIDYSKTKVEISGGTFVGMNPSEIKYFQQTADNKLDITSKPTTDGCATGYKAVENADGSYGVKPWNLEIHDVKDLMIFAEMAIAGNTFEGETVKLMADIDLNWAEWYPINFYGTFEGNGHTISNITYIPRDDGRMGFFQLVSGPVSDLTLDGIKGTVPANGRFGGFARYLNAAVENIHVKNIEVTTTDTLAWVGGFTTYTAGGSTKNCSVENLTVNAQAGADLIGGFISLTSNRQLYENSDVKGFKVIINDTHSSGCGVGGFVGQTQTGWNNPKFKDCDVTGIDVTASGLVDVGGFIAWPGAHTEYAENCTTQGKIDVTGVTSENCFAGGFFGNLGWNCDLGYMGHVLNNCSANVDIITKTADAGGFVGSATNSNNNSMYATFNNCSAAGDITCVEGGTADIGGFFGDGDRGVYNSCTASGIVTNNGTGYSGTFGGALYDVTPKYDHRYPAGTREYAVDEITLDNCTANGTASSGKFIGNTAENVDVTIKNHVAQIGEDKFYSLADAIAAVKAGEIITLLADNAETVTIQQAKDLSFTIDGAGNTMTGKITVKGRNNSEASETLTIKNIIFKTDVKSHVFIDATGSQVQNLTVEGCTFASTALDDNSKAFHNGVTAVKIKTAGNVTVKECVADPIYYLVNNISGGRNLVVDSCTVNGFYGIRVHNNIDAVIRNTTLNTSVHAIVLDAGNTAVTTIENCNITVATDDRYAVYYNAPANERSVAVNGRNTFTNTADAEEAWINAVTGADFKVTMNDTALAEPAGMVAKIGNTYYNTLAYAIKESKDNDTIVVVGDIDLANAELQVLDGYDTYFLVEGKTVTIDLNGKTISGAYTGSMLVGVFSTDNNGKLTLTGNGTVDVTATGKVYTLITAYNTGSSVIIENGTYKLDKASDSLIFYGGDKDAEVIVKGGTFTLGNVGTGENGKPWIFNVYGAGDHHVLVTGGTFNADINRQHWSNEAVVAETHYVVKNENGTWTVEEGAVAYVATGMTTGPYFYRKNVGYATIEEAFKAAVDYKDGNITLLQDVQLTKDVEISIEGIVLNDNGKKFDCNGHEINLTAEAATLTAAEGLNVTTGLAHMKVVYDENGIYKVAPKVYVAQIGETKYESVQEAINAAKDNDTIVVLADIDLAKSELQVLDGSYDTYFLVEGKSVTIDLNGKTISGAYTGSMLVGVFSTDKNGHLTLTGNGTVDVTATGKVYTLITAFNTGSTVTIENGTYKLDKASDSLIFYGGKTDAEVTVKGGTFTLGNVGTGENGKPWIFNVVGAGDHHILITGGTFNADINRQHWSNEAVVAKTHYVVNNGDGTWTVNAGAVAYVNTGMVTGPYYAPKDVGYATIEEAFAAAVAYNDVNITLLKNVALSKDVEISIAGIVLNDNGFKLDCNGHEIKLTDAVATLTAAEGLNVTTTVENGLIDYSEGTYKVIAAAAKNQHTGKIYATVNEALDEAKSGETVIMLKDSNGKMTYVPAGVTLDLNGCTYSATYMVVFNGGNIVDNSESNAGRLKVDSGKFIASVNNKQLPVNTADGYMFVEIIKWNARVGNGNGEIGNKFGFQAFVEPVAHEALLQTSEDSGVKFMVRVSWTNSQGGTSVQSFSYLDQSVWNVINSYNAQTNKYSQMLAITLSGLDSYDHLTFEAVIVSETGVEISSNS